MSETKRDLNHHESFMGSGDSGFSFDDDDLPSIFSQRPGVDWLHDLHGLDTYMSFADNYGFSCSPPPDAYDSHRGVEMSKFVSGNNTSGSTGGGGGGGGGGGMPVTPNSSISSSSTEMIVDDSGRCKNNQRKQEEEKQQHEAKEVEDVGDDNPNKKIKQIIRKKVEKRKREPSFAFMTKSEVDHLEDGYRWRKYGQKAVKNSPYPRSYYRCTTQKCLVKKRVERSYQDPTVVITTYEGQHTHQSPATIRGGSHLFAPPSPMLSSFRHEMISHEMNHNVQLQGGTNRPSNNIYLQNLPTPLHQLQISDYGLLQDMIVPSFINDSQRP